MGFFSAVVKGRNRADGGNTARQQLMAKTPPFDNKSSAVAEMGDRLATIDMGQKVGPTTVYFTGRHRKRILTI